jgi:lipid-A-disaccharide synthase
MRYFIIAGEASGDLHGSNLISGLKKADPGAEFVCWGGDMMEKAGAKLLMHYRNTAIMGFSAIMMNIRTIYRNISLCKEQVKEYSPDLVILIDYPGFNLRIAEFSKSLGLKVFYYISPKLWAWKESRVGRIKSYVDRMFIIFPFEVEFYKKHGISVSYFGNPVVDEMEAGKKELDTIDNIKRSLGLGGEPVITMLAGSRKQEVRYILPTMLKAVKHFPGYRFVLATVNNIPEEFYRKIMEDADVTLIPGKTYELLKISEAALVKSGTSTLEAALMDIPQVVCYAGDLISFVLAKMVVKIKYISLVNIILGREAVRELLQFDLSEKIIVHELKAILKGGARREIMLSDYRELKGMLGPEGASDRIATEMVKALKGE